MEESSSYSGPNLPSDWAGPACTILSPDEFEALSEPGVGSNAWVNDESGIGASVATVATDIFQINQFSMRRKIG